LFWLIEEGYRTPAGARAADASRAPLTAPKPV
jgi:hypothetical protein